MQVNRPTLPLTGPISRADFQALNDLTVALETADINSVVAAVQAALGNGVAGTNYFRNEAFDLWTRGSSPVSLVANVRTERADDWWARPDAIGSVAPTYGRVAAPTDKTYLYAAEITGGDTSTGNVDFGQEIAARIAIAGVAVGSLTLTFDLYNGTGASFTPTIRLDTCTSFQDYTSVNNRISQSAGSAVANGATKTYTVTLDVSSIGTYLRNGCLLYIRIPDGRLDSISQYVRFLDTKLEVGSTATSRSTNPDPLGDASTGSTGATSIEREFLFNADFAEARWGANISAAPAAADSYVAQGWWLNPSAGTPGYNKVTDSPNNLTKYAAQIVGNTGVVAHVDFGQNLSGGNTAGMSQQTVISFYLKNNTAADFQPLLRIDTCNSLNNFSSVTNVVSQALQTCSVGVWTRVSYAFTGSDYSNWSNGARIYLRFPTGVITTSPAGTVSIAQAKLERGTTASAFLPEPTFEVPGGLQGAVQNLVISTTSVSALDISADAICLRASDGSLQFAQNVSISGVSITGSGAGGLDTGSENNTTWYAIHVIGNGTSVAGLFSTSATNPSMPAGYRYRAHVGWVRNGITGATGDFVQFVQFGNSVLIAPTVVFTLKKPAAANTYELISTPSSPTNAIGTLIPATARFARGLFGQTTAEQGWVAFAANASGIGEVQSYISAAFTTGFGGFLNVQNFRVPILAGSQNFYWKRDSITNAYNELRITGWEY